MSVSNEYQHFAAGLSWNIADRRGIEDTFGKFGGLLEAKISQHTPDDKIEELEICLADLYETTSSKVTATRRILELARRMDCLAHLAYHKSAMCALARVSREEGRKNFDLRLNIISTMFILSLFHNFHKILLEQNIGRTTMQCLLLEIGKMEFLQKELLCQVLNHRNLPLLIITIKFLKKLSIFEEDKDTMKENRVISKLACLLICEDSLLLFAALGLLWNLSFDINLKREMVECKLPNIFERFIYQKNLHYLVFGLLYNLSQDKDLLLQFENVGNIMTAIMMIICEELSEKVFKEVTALLVNLTMVRSYCEHMYQPKVIRKLLTCAEDSSNLALFKVLQNLSRFDNGASLLAR